MQDPTSPRRDAYEALRIRDFRVLLIGRLIAQTGEMMVSVAVGWELYERTSDAFVLGMIGLVQVLPLMLCSIPAGYIVDHHNRKRITLVSQLILILCALTLTWLSVTKGPLWVIYAVLAVIGATRAFNNPAENALTPLVVPAKLYQNAVTWSTSTWQIAAIVGPSLSGFIIALTDNPATVYFTNAVSGLALVTALLMIHPRQQTFAAADETPIESLRAGWRFLRQNRLILSSIGLDMFAVLLGGATYLLPIFAKDILHVGSAGLGIMRAAPSIGALTMAFFIANRPPFQRSGRILLFAVAGFGVATILFGLSKSFIFSLVMLFILGALDNISVVIRHVLEMTFTPDEMRGRVGSIQTVFIGASNELGGFESGLAAALLGAVGAVVFGGVGTLVVVAAIAYLAPELRNLGQIVAQHEEIEPPEKISG